MLTASSVSLLTGIFQGVNIIQRRIMLTESSVSLLTGSEVQTFFKPFRVAYI